MAYNPSNPNGQATMANSEPVVIASDQSSIPVTVNPSSSVAVGPANITEFAGNTISTNSGVVDDGTLRVVLPTNQTSIPVTDNGGSLTIDGSVSVSNFPATQPVSGSVSISGTALIDTATSTALRVQISDGASNVPIDAAHADGDANTENHIDVGAKAMVFNGTSWDRQRGDTTGTFMIGNVAHDTADSGNPVKVGFQAEATLPTAVASGDRANGVSDVFGRQLIGNIDSGMQIWKSANYTTQQTGASMWTPSSGKRIVITYLSVSSYATTAARVIIWFGASADTTYSAGTDQLVFAGSFAPSANSKPGAIIQLPFGINAVTADHQLRITTDAAISLDLTIYGYEI